MMDGRCGDSRARDEADLKTRRIMSYGPSSLAYYGPFREGGGIHAGIRDRGFQMDRPTPRNASEWP